MIDPPVCDPIAPRHMPLATAAAVTGEGAAQAGGAGEGAASGEAATTDEFGERSVTRGSENGDKPRIGAEEPVDPSPEQQQLEGGSL